jgi:zinc transport system substrate-binding protein
MGRSTLIAFVAFVAAGCSGQPDPWEGTPAGQTKVLTVFPPLYCFTANVAKDHANVLCLLTGKGPHSYQATENDARKVAGADLFFINGIELDNKFVKDLVRMSRRKLKADAIGDALDSKTLVRMAEHDHDHGDGHDHHHHGDYDPHVWLGPKHSQIMVAAIAKKLADRDPAHKDDYLKNADIYIGKLKELEAYGLAQFKDKKSKSLITMHESLRYFADGFGLELIDSIQPNPDVDADAKQLARLVDVCKAKKVSVIAVEPQYSDAQAKRLVSALAKDVTIKLALVDPMETAPPVSRGNPDPNFYLDRMKANIDALAKAFP